MRPFDNPRPLGAARVALAGLALVVLSPGLAGAATSARGELETFFRRAIAIQTEATSATQARDDVRGLARALFDGREASRRALGPDWEQCSSAERADLARTFTGVLERAYLTIVRARLPRDRPPTIRVIGEDLAGERLAVVRTTVRTRQGSDAQLDYRMTRPDKRWLIGDVVIDGVSLVDNYRAQLAHTRRRSSYAELVARLRTVAGTPADESIAASPSSRPSVLVTLGRPTGPDMAPQTP
ncbi:MAG TPA: ABC transporter substrate-binding protein [Methylomirabilota bacterium]|nr:ABC transporter substrate-binding protein [Methylomirabilota bacterium]